MILLFGAAHAQEGPVLGPGDQIDLSVFARPELSRPYRIRSDGTISIHILGPIEVAGLSEGDLEDVIGAAMVERFEGPVSVTVEVSSWRDVTVAGAVEDEGAVPFVPGLDVRAAVALAGGVETMGGLGDQTDTVRMRVRQEAATVARLEARLAALLSDRARLATLASETAGAQPVATMSTLVGEETAEVLARSQAVLAEAQSRADALAISASRSQEALASEEADAFAARQEVVNSQLATTRAALAEQETLFERGLARSSNLLDLRVDVDRLRADELEAIGLAASARQKIDRAADGREITLAEQERDAAGQLVALEAEIAEVQAQLDGATRFVREFGGSSLLRDGSDLPPLYVIHRRSGGISKGLAADPTSPLMPGDVLEVMLPEAEAL
ncbi:polysaccharide biosynthesis/export family protein [Jannaschia sp. LMIT008]|uniref:polysaccharide biosynthesis/export family protein n=1 Tax=Jannaschia maritima TaxID=3032585 RepID=UPI002810D8E8|nr:polysaccharide biosynthesis/export family protein [Jannaschia sp. LMIT008]